MEVIKSVLIVESDYNSGPIKINDLTCEKFITKKQLRLLLLLLLLLLLFIYLVKQVSIYNGSEMYTDVDLRIKIKKK